MADRQFLRLSKIENIVNDPDFLDSIAVDDNIDIAQLIPDKLHGLSDLEEIDEDILDDSLPTDVPWKTELHYNLNKSDLTNAQISLQSTNKKR